MFQYHLFQQQNIFLLRFEIGNEFTKYGKLLMLIGCGLDIFVDKV